MSVSSQHFTLSSLVPVEISYTYNNEEALKKRFCLYNYGLQTYNYELFKNFKDAAISKKTALVLTEIKDLNDVFETTLESVDIGKLAGNCYLQAQDNELLDGDVHLKLYNNNLYVGGKGQKAVFTIVPVSENKAYLKVDNFYLQRAEKYPYNIELSLSKLPETENDRQYFYINYNKNKISFKTKTSEGYRYLSYHRYQRFMCCTGVELNNTLISQYLFTANFLSPAQISYGYDPGVLEIKYYNSIESGEVEKSVNVSETQKANTNLLVSIPSYSLVNTTGSVANISLLKTNFSTVGTFNPSI